MAAPKTFDNEAVFKEFVDHDTIFNLLYRAVRPIDHTTSKVMRGISDSHLMSELRTIGWEATRQQGSTQWIINRMLADETATMVTVNSGMRDFILQKAPTLKGRVLISRTTTSDKQPILPTIPLGKFVYVDGRMEVVFGKRRRKFFDWTCQDGNRERVIVVVGK